MRSNRSTVLPFSLGTVQIDLEIAPADAQDTTAQDGGNSDAQAQYTLELLADRLMPEALSLGLGVALELGVFNNPFQQQDDNFVQRAGQGVHLEGTNYRIWFYVHVHTNSSALDKQTLRSTVSKVLSDVHNLVDSLDTHAAQIAGLQVVNEFMTMVNEAVVGIAFGNPSDFYANLGGKWGETTGSSKWSWRQLFGGFGFRRHRPETDNTAEQTAPTTDLKVNPNATDGTQVDTELTDGPNQVDPEGLKANTGQQV